MLIVSHPPRFALCSCLIGVEAVDNMVLGTKEFTLLYPSLTNEVGTCALFGHLHALRFSSLSLWSDAKRMQLAYTNATDTTGRGEERRLEFQHQRRRIGHLNAPRQG